MATNSKKPIFGLSTPRIQSNPVKGRSLGPLVSDLADHIGIPFMPWQRHVMDDALKVDANNNWIRTTTGILVARQSGKSHLVRMRVLAGLYLFGDAQAYGIAQNRRLSIDHLWKIVDMADSVAWMRKRIKRISRTNGSESIEVWCHHYPNECEGPCNRVRKFGVLAATADGARGASADFLWVDELREIQESVWSAAAPITRARPNPSTWVSSNAGDLTSTVLNDLRNRALANDNPRLGWYEWSAEPGCRIDDVKAWQQANPALGHTVQIQSLQDSVARDHPDTVRTELLCQWILALDSPWNMDEFDAGTDRTLVLDSSGVPTWAGLDLVFNRTEAFLVTAQEVDGKLRVFLHQWKKDGPINDRELASDIATIARQYKIRQIAFDPNTGGFIAPLLQKAGIRMESTPWSSAYFATLCDVTMSSMNAGRILHTGQVELRTHLAACARRPASDGGWRIARRASQTPISAAVAMVLAVGHAEAPRTAVVSAVV